MELFAKLLTRQEPILSLSIDFSQCHSPGYCDVSTGECIWPEFPDGTSCDDSDKCTSVDTCSDGICSGIHQVCESQDDCLASQGICDPETGSECSLKSVIQ